MRERNSYRRFVGVAMTARRSARGGRPELASASGGFAAELGPGVTVSHQSETGTVGFVGTRAGYDPRLRRLRFGARPRPRPAPSSTATRAASASPAAPPACGSRAPSRPQPARPRFACSRPIAAFRCSAASSPWSSTAPTGCSPCSARPALRRAPTPIPRSAPPTRPTPRSARSPAATTSSAADLRASQPRLKLYDPRLLGAPSPFQKGRAAWVLDVTSDDATEPIDELVVVDAAVRRRRAPLRPDRDRAQPAHLRRQQHRRPRCRAPRRCGPRAARLSPTPSTTSTTRTTSPATPTTSTSTASAATASTAPA